MKRNDSNTYVLTSTHAHAHTHTQINRYKNSDGACQYVLALGCLQRAVCAVIVVPEEPSALRQKGCSLRGDTRLEDLEG